MAKSAQSDAILKLGAKLVEELGGDQRADTLCRWMAHHIAELIKDAETANPKDRGSKSAMCATAIFDLWKHRHEMPTTRRPFREIDQILRTLASLDPEDNTPRYFRQSFLKESGNDTESNKWLKLADSLDRTARVLIRYCLGQASKKSVDKSNNWVALAEAAGAEDDFDTITVRFVSAEHSLTKAPKDDGQKLLKDRIARLKAFKKAAASLNAHLQRQIKPPQKRFGKK